MIRRIELINFMSHEHTVIEPSAGLTVLVGPNNCGKSAVVAALQILAHNDASTYVMRHGAKETSVIVETDDGHEITWSRKRSGSPRYIVDGTLFDRLGRSVPDEVRKALRLSKVTAGPDSGSAEFDLHFGEQKAPVFLIDRPGSQAAQFFASSSDAEKLVRMQSRHKEKVREANRDLSRLTAEIRALGETAASLASVDTLATAVADLESRYDAITRSSALISEGQDNLAELEQTVELVSYATARATALLKLGNPPEITDTSGLSRLIDALAGESRALIRWKSEAGALAPLQSPPPLADPTGRESLIRRLQRAEAESAAASSRATAAEGLREPPEIGEVAALKAATAAIESAQIAAAGAQEAATDAVSAAKEAENALRAWAAEHTVCPTCGGPVGADQLVKAAATGVHHHGA